MEANVVVLQSLAALFTVLVLYISGQCARAIWRLVWWPFAVARSFSRQGIRGPPYRFIVGSLPECRRLLIAGRATPLDDGCHNYSSLVHPFFQKWTSEYGKTFLFWLGPIPSICSTDMELVKQVLSNKTDLFHKFSPNSMIEVIFGNGLILLNGNDWKRHRRVVHPVFNQDKLKPICSVHVSYSVGMHKTHDGSLVYSDSNGQRPPIRDKYQMHEFGELTLAVIAPLIFGKDYEVAWEIYHALEDAKKLVMPTYLVPSIYPFRYVPTRRNRQSWQLNKRMASKITHLIRARLINKDPGAGYGDDLLGLMMQAWSKDKTMSTEEIIGECKTFIVAGQDTTQNLLTWAMFLLSSNPQWQEKVREEILRECQRSSEVPSYDTLSKLKLLSMTLLETLRLYNPVVFLARKTTSDSMLANIEVPKETMITIPISMLHRDKDVWGPDADEFNPMRFKHGVSRATRYPNALLAFSSGPRGCSGQNFAMVEAQLVMVMILKRFSFSLSPKYVHKPTNCGITLVPRYGLPLIVRTLPDGPNHNI